jgi:hypothetical protein
MEFSLKYATYFNRTITVESVKSETVPRASMVDAVDLLLLYKEVVKVVKVRGPDVVFHLKNTFKRTRDRDPKSARNITAHISMV